MGLQLERAPASPGELVKTQPAGLTPRDSDWSLIDHRLPVLASLSFSLSLSQFSHFKYFILQLLFQDTFLHPAFVHRDVFLLFAGVVATAELQKSALARKRLAARQRGPRCCLGEGLGVAERGKRAADEQERATEWKPGVLACPSLTLTLITHTPQSPHFLLLTVSRVCCLPRQCLRKCSESTGTR